MANEKARAYRILFEEPVAFLSGKPLFATPTELAASMVEWRIRSGTSLSLAAYLNQIFSRRERNCSSELRDHIFKAIDKRFEDKNENGLQITEGTRWKERFSHAVEADNADLAWPSSLNAEQLTYELFDRAECAEEQFIITSNPAEVARTEEAMALQNILLRRLGLTHLAIEGELPKHPESKTRYTFNFPSKEMATGWWETLYDEVEANAERGSQEWFTSEGRDRIHSALTVLNEQGSLVVQVISPEICALPIVAFDPLGPHASAYAFFYHDGIGTGGVDVRQSYLSVAKLDRQAYITWSEAVYRKIRRGHIKPEPENISYEDILKKKEELI